MKKIFILTTLLITFLLTNSTNLMAGSCSLRVSDNGRFLVDEYSRPFFLNSTKPLNMIWELDREEIASYINQRKAQKFNAITIVAADGWNSNSVNAYSDAPYEHGNWHHDASSKWDPENPIITPGNDPSDPYQYDYWDHIEYIIDLAAESNMYVNFFPIDGPHLGPGSERIMEYSWETYIFGNWIGDMFKDKANIIWCFGSDISPSNQWHPTKIVDNYNGLAKGIADGVNGVNNEHGATDYSTTLMTFSPKKWEYSSSYWFNNEEWLDFNSIHEVPGRAGEPTFNQIYKINLDYNKTLVKPTSLFRSLYEGNVNGFAAWQSRFQVYQTVFAGGFGASYGNQNVYDFGSGWESNMGSDGAEQMQHLLALMTSVDDDQFLDRIPDQSLIVGDTGEIYNGDWYQNKSTIIQATRTAEGDSAMIYSANGRNITVNMDILKTGTMKAEWLNPRNGVWTVINTNIQSGASAPTVEFDPPGTTAEENDYVLVLTKEPGPNDPLLVITNQSSTVTYDVTTASIGGTNNANVVGTMNWSNQLTGAMGNMPATESWTINDIVLNIGLNIITVYGTNDVGLLEDDSVTILRGGPGTGVPTLDITNENAAVVYNTTEYTIGFVFNTNLVGNVSWINQLTGVQGEVDSLDGEIQNITLDVGSNVIAVTGENSLGDEANDSVTIIRTASLAVPFVDVITEDAIVSFVITEYDIAGTNNANIVGTMSWSNELSGAVGTVPATESWTIENIALNVNANIIVVTGTNVYGDIASDSVTITRFSNPESGLHVSDNNRFLVQHDGTPFYPQNDWGTKIPWMLSIDEAKAYIEARKSQGFNVISMYAIANYLGDDGGVPPFGTVNYYGFAPFEGTDTWNVEQPVDEYWEHIGNIIDIAASNGIYVNLAPMPTILVGGGSESFRVFTQGDVSACYQYGNWVGQLYRDKTNMIWTLGGGKKPDNYYDYTPQFDSMAKGIADGFNGISDNETGETDYNTTLMTYDGERWTYSSSHWFNNEEWLDFNSLHEVPGRDGYPQYNQVTETTLDYNLNPVKPTWLLGPVSEDRSGHTEFQAWQSRFQAYQTVFAGAFGSSFGNQYIEDGKSGWDTHLDSDGANQMQYLTDLMTSVSDTQFLTRIPDQSLIDGDTGGIYYGTWYQSKSTIIQATRAENRDNAMIYCANGRNISVNMDQLGVAGTVMTAYWYNPRNGEYTLIDNNVSCGTGAPIVEFDPSGTIADENDWVLVLNGVPEPLLFINCYLLFFIYYLKRK